MELIIVIMAIILAITLFLFIYVILFGAPYLPTLSRQVTDTLDLLDFKKGSTLIELGCGDGKVMVAAAEKGIKVIG